VYHMDRSLLQGVLLTGFMFMSFVMALVYAAKRRQRRPIKPEPLEEQDHHDALDDKEESIEEEHHGCK
jgi:hypothetical protein